MNKTLFIVSVLLVTACLSAFADIKLITMSGPVRVRHGVQVEWTKPSVGDILKPEDSIELGKNATAILLVDGKIRVPLTEQSILDLSDLRPLSQEELLLLLAMEGVRAVPDRQNPDGLPITRTTTTHGADRDATAIPDPPAGTDAGVKFLRGVKTLYDNGFYATCILREKATLRIWPDLKGMLGTRLLVADAMLRMNVRQEALGEYLNLAGEKLSPRERALVEQKIKNLKNSSQ